jgi:hypothetical protein
MRLWHVPCCTLRALRQSAWSPRGHRVAVVRGGDRRAVVRTACAGGWGRQSGERSVRRVVLGAAGQVSTADPY